MLIGGVLAMGYQMAHHQGAVLVPQAVEKIHITIFTALAALAAAVPGIPDVVHVSFLSECSCMSS